jgi:kinesin family protein 3/17
MNKREKRLGNTLCLDRFRDKKRVALDSHTCLPGERKSTFKFAHVFDQKNTQLDVYNQAARPILEAVMNGFNGTILTYGQTSSGKTYTMQGIDRYEEP